MKIAIVGAGIVGITTAYELAVDGHEVTVFDRHGSAAEEASFATGGLIAAGYLAVASRASGLRTVTGHRASLPWPPSLRDWRWLSAWRRAGAPVRWHAARARVLALAHYSRDRLHALSGPPAGLRLRPGLPGAAAHGQGSQEPVGEPSVSAGFRGAP
jgi:D-amino-acid dehydrogenase